MDKERGQGTRLRKAGSVLDYAGSEGQHLHASAVIMLDGGGGPRRLDHPRYRFELSLVSRFVPGSFPVRPPHFSTSTVLLVTSTGEKSHGVAR